MDGRNGPDIHFIMLNNKIFRHTQAHLDQIFEPFGLSSGALAYLFSLERCEGVSQNKISRRIGNDKAMSARMISRLVEQGFVRREPDPADSRAFCLYLTERTKEILPTLHEEIRKLVDQITVDLTEDEKQITLAAMKKIYLNTQRLAGRGGNE